jgi:hypothetical protein
MRTRGVPDGSRPGARDPVSMRSPTDFQRPRCPVCGEQIGAYEPLWRLAPEVGAEPTSWLRVKDLLEPFDTLWHAACAEADGVSGG